MILTKPKHTAQDLAAFLTPGMLGLQKVNEKPFNLLLRPEREADPRIQLLTTQNWSELKKAPGVLFATATLEAYNELENSGLEYTPTKKVYDWITSFEVIPALYSDLDKSPLFGYQKDAVRFLYSTKRAMLSLSPGLGKTLTSAYAAGLAGFDQILLVCPASLLYFWRAELEKWSSQLPRQPFVTILHRKDAKSNFLDFPEADQHWLITNPETIVQHIEKVNKNVNSFDCMIVDESIMYKHRDSERSKAIKKIAGIVENVWLLTGAPATRNLDDMHHQFHILNPRGYSSYWRFARKYCVVVDDQWGSKVVANKRNAEKEIQKNFADIYFSRSQDDVLDIPDWIFEDVDIAMLPKQDEVYNTLREELYIKVGELGDEEEITVNNHLALMIRSIQVASNPALVGAIDEAGKWDALPELMQVYPGPYIVWVNFIQSGLALREKFSKLGMTVGLANGSTPMLDRQLMVDTMQAGNMDVLILNNQVGKFGFNLTKVRTAFFVERMYDDSYFQCLHRNRRIGTTQSPIVVNMRSVTQKGHRTVDHVVHETLDYRNGMIKKVTARMLKEVLRPQM